jgi:hypothetical protein
MSPKRETYSLVLRPLVMAALNSPGLLPPAQFNMARFNISPRLRAHLIDPDISALEDYLIDHSDLPGRRANLELVAAFADEIGALCTAPDVSLNHSYVAMEWLLWEMLNRYPPAIFGGDPDSPLQMPQLCGAVAFGEWAAMFQHIEAGVATLMHLADSSLWRIREGVAMGVQRMLAAQWDSTIRRLRRRVLDAPPYEMRAIVAGIAEPDLLREPARALTALDLHYEALTYLRRLPADLRPTDAVRTFRQALGYSISVVVAAAPEAGFALMRAWAAWDDPDVTWALRENLKKKRLAKWPDQVAALRQVVGGAARDDD